MMRLLCMLIMAILLSACQTGQITAARDNAPGGKIAAQKKKGIPGKAVMNNRNKKVNSSTQDGPPPGPLPTRFKKIVPVNAPLSRYGNPGAYVVKGHTYEVMTTASGYRTRGLASWYGTRFHSKRTSSGEDYDMYALTAAHKTLPIPCYVKVKNLENGRVATVKVNDRGPFHAGRVIDLSYAAAAKLGLFPKGTARVEIEALTTTSAKGARPAHYYLQAGAFSSGQLAILLQNKLAKLSPSPVFIEKNQLHYLVRVGPFANRNMAESLRRTLARNGVNGAFSLLM